MIPFSKYFLICYLILFTACSNSNKKNEINSFPKIENSNKKRHVDDKKITFTEKDYSKFKKLTSAEQIKSSAKLGKLDPFSNSINQEEQLPFPDIELRGIIHTSQESSAIIKYNNKSGEVRLGEVGGITTNLLPNGIKLIQINLAKENIFIMDPESKSFKIKLQKL